MLLIYPIVSNCIQNLIEVWPRCDVDCWNYQMIPVHLNTVSILPWEAKSLSRAFAVDGKIDVTTVKCQCTCVIRANVKFLAEYWPTFQRWGCDRIPIPYAYGLQHATATFLAPLETIRQYKTWTESCKSVTSKVITKVLSEPWLSSTTSPPHAAHSMSVGSRNSTSYNHEE